MNERIRELEAQCWEPRSHPNAQAAMGDRFNTEKFAELLVEECLLAISKTPELFTEEEVAVMVKCHNHVEKYLGVK